MSLVVVSPAVLSAEDTASEVGAGSSTTVLSTDETTSDVGVGSSVTSDGGVTVTVPRIPPVTVGTAYGGSKSPKSPQALHGYAQEVT
jgi:hypothetical protein